MTRKNSNCFPPDQRQAIYDVIYARRDIRSQFLPDAIEPEVLYRVLDAAHHAGSVGFMQPWNFLVVTDIQMRQRIRPLADRYRGVAEGIKQGTRRFLFDAEHARGLLVDPH